MLQKCFEAFVYGLAAVGLSTLLKAAHAAPGNGGAPPGPPPQAIATCQGTAAGPADRAGAPR